LKSFIPAKKKIEMTQFNGIGIIKNEVTSFKEVNMQRLRKKYAEWLGSKSFSKEDIIKELLYHLPELEYQDKGKYLDEKM
jgi:hypothetical protein